MQAQESPFSPQERSLIAALNLQPGKTFKQCQTILNSLCPSEVKKTLECLIDTGVISVLGDRFYLAGQEPKPDPAPILRLADSGDRTLTIRKATPDELPHQRVSPLRPIDPDRAKAAERKAIERTAKFKVKVKTPKPDFAPGNAIAPPNQSTSRSPNPPALSQEERDRQYGERVDAALAEMIERCDRISQTKVIKAAKIPETFLDRSAIYRNKIIEAGTNENALRRAIVHLLNQKRVFDQQELAKTAHLSVHTIRDDEALRAMALQAVRDCQIFRVRKSGSQFTELQLRAIGTAKRMRSENPGKPITFRALAKESGVATSTMRYWPEGSVAHKLLREAMGLTDDH